MFGNGPTKREPRPNTQVIESHKLAGLDLTKLQAAVEAAVEEHGMTVRDPKGPGMTFDAQAKGGKGVTVYGEARKPSIVTRGWSLDIESLAASA